MRWQSEFTIEDTDKAERGTDIVLYIDDDCKEFLEEARIFLFVEEVLQLPPHPSCIQQEERMERRQAG